MSLVTALFSNDNHIVVQIFCRMRLDNLDWRRESGCGVQNFRPFS